ncbi:MAG TPA: AAA family ATPase [Acetobacteraceae bacterium]|nr:AAA family ATPase [Acetobacteraceae bacterium]
MPPINEETFSFQQFTLDLRRGCLRDAAHEIELRPKSFAVLRHLVENAGRLVSKDELIELVWANVTVSDVSLARCVSDVRLALRDQAQRIIRTVPRRGYLFAVPVARIANPTRPVLQDPDKTRSVHHAGEYRQLTVLACELAGLAELSARLDPEDLREATTSCYRRCAGIVERHHGYVAHDAGGDLLAWFGYPEALEQDAENAVRAALALQDSATQLSRDFGTRLQPSIGIATGIVMIDEEPATSERKATGEPLTLSARLQAQAEPGQIVIAQSTRRIAGGLFEYQDLGPVLLKGLAAPVEIARVVGESEAENRFAAYHPAGLTPLVGREEEIALLLRRWRQAKGGEGSTVLLEGEPGIGKSRITQTLLDLLRGEDHERPRLFCSPHHRDSPLYPAIGYLARVAGLRRTDGGEQRLARLETALAATAADFPDAAPLLADLLAVPVGDRYAPVTLTPQARKTQILRVLLGQIEALAAVRPVLLVIEDVHWADPTTLELIDLIVERTPCLPLLLIITFRPEFISPWDGRIQTTSITIGRLPPRRCAEIVSGVLHGKQLPQAITTEILDRTDGIPLFVEELTKAVVESGALIETGDGYTVTGSLPPRAIPMTLRASLLARLDRLGLAPRDVAQIGAALGRRFSHDLIAAVAALPAGELDDALARLTGAGLMSRRGMPPDAEYTFKHALVQDAAYGTLLREPRRALHARIAATLAARFGDIAENQPDLLAHHCTEAGLIEQAAGLWGKAGQLSLARSALREAAAQLTKAVGQIETLPGTPARRREQITLQIALANALMHTKGYAAPETKVALDQARRLVEPAEAFGEPPDDPLLLYSVLHGFWVANHVAFNGDVVRELADRFMAMAQKQGARFPLVLGHRLVGTSLLFLGDVVGGREHLDRALELYDPPAHRPLATRFGHDVGVAILSNRPYALWLLGYPQAARDDCAEALRQAREIGQAASYLYALTRIASFNLVSGDFGAATAQSRELVAIAEEKDGSYWKAAGMMTQGCLFALTGEPGMAVQLITAGMTASQSTGANLRLPWSLSCLARAHAGLGQHDEAWRRIDQAMEVMEATKETWQEPELHRVAGDLTLLLPEPNASQAQAHYERALAVAREQKAKSWELRVALSLGRLWRDQGEPQRAHDLIAPICSWFSEKVDPPDLIEAKTLLTELGDCGEVVCRAANTLTFSGR